jgi:two-component system LytT family sensor kinase
MASEPHQGFLSKRRHRWGVILAIWTIVGLFYTSRDFLLSSVREQPLPTLFQLVPTMLDAYAWAVLTIPILWLSSRFPFRRDSWVPSLPVHVVASVFFATLVVWFNWNVAQRIYADWSHSFPRFFAGSLHWNIQWYWMIVGVDHGVDYYRRYRDRQLHASRLETQLVNAQLQSLKMQLQPHFLFNTLHAISELVHEDPDAADRMITRLGDLLRLSIDASATQEISLRDELEFLRAYLEIEQTRFQDHLTVYMQIDPGTLDAQVPNLLLQPLVENAIRHGTAARTGAGEIAITATRDDGTLRLIVRDNGKGLPTERPVREGVGVGNTRARLQQLYGHDHRFELRNDAGGGVVATVEIPYRPGAPTSTRSYRAWHKVQSHGN